jgi:hypothetical protein
VKIRKGNPLRVQVSGRCLAPIEQRQYAGVAGRMFIERRLSSYTERYITKVPYPRSFVKAACKFFSVKVGPTTLLHRFSPH